MNHRIAVLSLTGLLIGAASCTPPARPISDVLNITDAAQQLSIRSIEMPAPSYLSGQGPLEKFYTSVVAVDVANDSDQELYLDMEYYADSGSIGLYSPGATSGVRSLAVPPRWSGELQYPLHHLRFVKGGSIRLTLAKCEAPGTEHHLPGHSEQLFEETYDMVSQQ